MMRTRKDWIPKFLMATGLGTMLWLSTNTGFASNILTNPSFESPSVGGGNHIGTAPTGWASNVGNAGFNLVGGTAYDGSQFVDLTNGGTYITQTFTLTTPRAVSFGGSFSPRGGATGGGSAAIYDATNTTLLYSSPYVSATGTDSPWRRSLAVSGVLPAGTYTYRGIIDDPGNLDLAFVDTAQITEFNNVAGPITPFSPSNTDLLQTSVSSVVSSGNFTQGSSGGVPVLTNGQFMISGGNPGNNSQLATVENGSFLVYNLDTSAAPDGYRVSGITTYGGWNDSGRDRQLYNISYSLVGDASFIPLDSLNYDPILLNNGLPSAIRAVFETDLIGVDAIRFDFPSGQENGYAGLGEIDVFGVAVPEPSSIALLLVAFGTAFGFYLKRRRSP